MHKRQNICAGSQQRPTRGAVWCALLVGSSMALSGAGCFEAPRELQSGDIIALTVLDSDGGPFEGALADGVTKLLLRVEVDPDTAPTLDIVVETTSGVLNGQADPDSSEARVTRVRNPGGGVVDVPLTVGTVSGEVLLSATIEGVASFATLELTPATAELLVLEISETSLEADGQSQLQARTRLLRQEPSEQVSLGQRLRFVVCCQGGGVACDPPLEVPRVAVLEQGDTVEITGVSRPRVGAGPMNIVLLATTDLETQDSALCQEEEPPSIFDTVQIEMLLPAPAPNEEE